MSEGIVGFKFQCLAIIRDCLVPGFLSRKLGRITAVAGGRLREARRGHRDQQKQEKPHRHSLAREKAHTYPESLAKKGFAGEISSPAWSDHQVNFALSCPMRGSRALVTTPKLPSISPLGFKN